MPTNDAHSPANADEAVQAVSDIELDTLLEQIDSGNQFAFRELYQRTSGQIFAVLLRILKTRPASEAALQDTYIELWNNAGRYNPKLGAPMIWLTSVARRQALAARRQRRTREGVETAFTAQTEPAVALSSDRPAYSRNGEQDHEDNSLGKPGPVYLVDSDDAELLLSCLDKLDENQRNCIIQAYCEGYSHEELSLKTGSTLGTVKGWIRRGLLALRECVNERT